MGREFLPIQSPALMLTSANGAALPFRSSLSATTRRQGVSTVVAMMLPYAAVSVVWILLFLAWELLGLPFGPE